MTMGYILCRTRLAKPNSQARTGTAKYFVFIFSLQLTTSRIGNLTWVILAHAICVTIHTSSFQGHSKFLSNDVFFKVAVQYLPYEVLYKKSGMFLRVLQFAKK